MQQGDRQGRGPDQGGYRQAYGQATGAYPQDGYGYPQGRGTAQDGYAQDAGAYPQDGWNRDAYAQRSAYGAYNAGTYPDAEGMGGGTAQARRKDMGADGYGGYGGHGASDGNGYADARDGGAYMESGYRQAPQLRYGGDQQAPRAQQGEMGYGDASAGYAYGAGQEAYSGADRYGRRVDGGSGLPESAPRDPRESEREFAISTARYMQQNLVRGADTTAGALGEAQGTDDPRIDFSGDGSMRGQVEEARLRQSQTYMMAMRQAQVQAMMQAQSAQQVAQAESAFDKDFGLDPRFAGMLDYMKKIALAAINTGNREDLESISSGMASLEAAVHHVRASIPIEKSKAEERDRRKRERERQRAALEAQIVQLDEADEEDAQASGYSSVPAAWSPPSEPGLFTKAEVSTKRRPDGKLSLRDMDDKEAEAYVDGKSNVFAIAGGTKTFPFPNVGNGGNGDDGYDDGYDGDFVPASEAQASGSGERAGDASRTQAVQEETELQTRPEVPAEPDDGGVDEDDPLAFEYSDDFDNMEDLYAAFGVNDETPTMPSPYDPAGDTYDSYADSKETGNYRHEFDDGKAIKETDSTIKPPTGLPIEDPYGALDWNPGDAPSS
jgi:hypothetical protein